MEKQEQIIQGFNYVKNIINSINIVGIDNCQKLMTIYNNIDIFLNMLLNNEISIIENKNTEKDKTVVKQESKSNSNSKT